VDRKFTPFSRFRHLRLYEHFLGVLIKYGFEEVANDLKRHLRLRHFPRPLERIARGHSRPVRLRMMLEELGPTFIKLGQFLSMRPDLLPKDYVEALKPLQDQARPLAFEPIRAQIERELGGNLDDHFREFHEKPLATGSIAQVHFAVTLEGRAVAVKVRRPRIEENIQTECEVLVSMVGKARGFLEKEGILDPHKVIKEFTEAVAKEVDLSHEARNQIRFWRNFSKDPQIFIPTVYEHLSTQAVLTMDYVSGIKVTDRKAVAASGLDLTKVAEEAVYFVLRQIFQYHLFHTDPHAGNVFLMPGNKIALIDFGQATGISARTRQLIMKWISAFFKRDVHEMVRVFVHEEMVGEQTNVDELSLDVEELFNYYFSFPGDNIPFTEFLIDNMALFREYRMKTPPGFTLILKSLLTVDGLGTELATDYRILPLLRNFVEEYRRLEAPHQLRPFKDALLDAEELFLRAPDHIHTIFKKLRRGRFNMQIQVEHLEALVKVLHFSAKYVSAAVIVAALLMASSFLVEKEVVLLAGIDTRIFGVVGYLLAVILGLWLLISMIRR
jgi:ubiquinone biosynthesis protein